MKAIVNDPNMYDTIKMALFVALNEPALKGSQLWFRMKAIFDSLEKYSSYDHIVLRNFSDECEMN